jgi:hypothetical protein
MSTESFDNSYLPKRMSIILYTKTNQYARKIYTPQMSIPTTSSSYVNFNPLVKINKDTFFREYNIKPNDTTSALNNKIIDIFLNKQKFDELLNKIVIDSNKKELTIQESCKDKVIGNNIKVTLDVLFKPGNVLEIDKKPYTVNSYTWLDGDWLIYSNDLKKDQIEDSETKGFYGYRNRSMYENEREKKFTKKAYDQLNKEIPNCLKGDLVGKSLLEIGDGEIAEQQIKADIVSNEKKMDLSTINSFFTEENKKLTEKYLFLPFNLDYKVPSFLKDPISVSLFYLGYDFSKEIGNFPRLKKIFDELKSKKKELKELIDKISSRTGNTKTNEKEEENSKKQIDTFTKENDYFNETIKELNNILTKDIKLCSRDNLSNILDRLNNLNVKADNPRIDINSANSYTSYTNSILGIIKNCNPKNIITTNNNNLYNNIISLIKEIKKKINNEVNENQNKIKSHERNNLISQYNSLKDTNKYIDKKKEYLTNCSETLELIKQKIEKQNQYLLLFIQFYKLLYEFKKKELADIESQINPDQIFFLKMMNQIILFDLTIYNTIYNNDGYKKRIEQTKSLIDQCIERIKKNNSIKNNIKDELINKSNDYIIFASYNKLIYYTNYVVDMDFWKIFSSKTTDIKTILFDTLSKTIYNFYKYNELLGKAPEYVSKLNNMKYSCFELIIIYSRINMISFLRKYTYDKYNKDFYEEIKDISSVINTENKYYLDLGLIHKYEKPDSSIKQSYQDYLTSVKLLTPSISTNDIEKICLDSFNNVTNDTPFVNNITSFDYKNIIENFEYKDDNLPDSFNLYKLIGYNGFKCVDAIQNALNWYLCLENKTYDNEIIKLDENILVDRIVEKYGINIMVIRNDSGTLKIHTNREKYNKTLYIYKEGTGENLKYYTILTNDNKVALFNKDKIPVDIKNIEIDKLPPIKGGTQREDIEKLMNQSLLNNLLQKPSSSDKQKMLMNTLAYIVPIKLELYEGKDITVGKKVTMKCEENYSNIIKAWKTLFKINEENKKEPTKPSLSSLRLSQQ